MVAERTAHLLTCVQLAAMEELTRLGHVDVWNVAHNIETQAPNTPIGEVPDVEVAQPSQEGLVARMRTLLKMQQREHEHIAKQVLTKERKTVRFQEVQERCSGRLGRPQVHHQSLHIVRRADAFARIPPLGAERDKES